MKTLEEWLDLYSRDHQNPVNKRIHNICVPLIMLSLVGLLHCIPSPFPNFHWSFVLVFIGITFYFFLSLRVCAFMFTLTAFQLSLVHYAWSLDPTLLLYSSAAIFIVSWIGQFIGHKIEGQKPSFFEDLQFLLIGPVWVFYPTLKKVGIL